MGLLGKLRASAVGSAVPEPAYANVLTPGRIPKFCIPPRMPAPCTSESPPLATSLPRRCAAESDLWPHSESTGRTDWDPRSQAALSLLHLPRARTAYGFCALLESPHTRRKESLFLGDPGAAALLRPPAARRSAGPQNYVCGGDVPRAPQGWLRPPATPVVTSCPRPPPVPVSSRPHRRRLLRATDRLLGRALRTRGRRCPGGSRPVSSGDEGAERGACAGPPTRASSASPPPPPLAVPRPERLEAEGTVALGRAGGAVRLAVEYCPGSGRLRIRLLRAEGMAGGAEEARALGCRLSFVLQSPGKTREQRGAVVQRSRNPVLDQDFCFDGLTEDEVRRMAVRVKAKHRGRGLERDRELGRGELLLGSLLLL